MRDPRVVVQKNGGYIGKGAGEVEAVQKSQDEVDGE